MPSLYKVSFLFAAMLAGVLAVHDEAGYCSNASGTGPTICSYVYFIGDTSDYEIYAFPIPGVAKCSDACTPSGSDSYACTIHDCSDTDPDNCGVATC